jgi:hypothetical protein
MRKALLLVLFFLFILVCGAAANTEGGTTPYEVTITPIRTSWPIAREASGQWELVGEAVFSNTGTETLVIQTINLEVFNDDGDKIADRTYSAEDFEDMIMIVTKSPDGAYRELLANAPQLAPGGLAFCSVAALAGNATLPKAARITVNFTNRKSETTDIDLDVFDPGQRMIWPLEFSGGEWAAFDTPDSPYHRRAINFNPASGLFFNDQRYAIDTVQIDSQFNISNPAESSNKEDYYAWGEDIVSPGSGTVVAVQSNQPDQEISKVWTTADTNPMGNYVIIRHSGNLYSRYVHMMQNSATVAVGDQVVPGQVIGKIGNSGMTGNLGVADGVPHLHFDFFDSSRQGVPALFWDVKVNRLSDTELQSIVGRLPYIREQDYGITAGAYILNGTTPLEFDIITAP